ncbi:GW dipeptide domain-containing protein [Salinicoccus bachuensis]|uniref:N-acetylmuramoyl-L-alanine amidase n=1 Tax=Salinicoccus bachuensis TaxID=3136731 RepID=A0ABZ3CJP3_9STAP
MKYKNRIIVPTFISTVMLGATINASADEVEVEKTVPDAVIHSEEESSSSINGDGTESTYQSEKDLGENISSDENEEPPQLEENNSEQEADPVDAKLPETAESEDELEADSAETADPEVAEDEVEADTAETTDPEDTEDEEETDTAETAESEEAEDEEEADTAETTDPEDPEAEEEADTAETAKSEDAEDEEETDTAETAESEDAEDEEETDTAETAESEDAEDEEDAGTAETAESEDAEDEEDAGTAETAESEDAEDEEDAGTAETAESEDAEDEEDAGTAETAESEDAEDELEADLEKAKELMEVKGLSLMSMAKVEVLSSNDAAYKMARINKENQGLKSPLTSEKSVSADRYIGSTYFVSKESAHEGKQYYFLRFGLDKAMIGWIRAEDVVAKSRSEDKNIRADYLINGENDYVYSQPWGTKEQTVQSINNLRGDKFSAQKETVVDGKTYLYGTVNGKSGWILKDYLVAESTGEAQTSDARMMARINKNNDGLKSPLTSDNSVSADRYTGDTYYVSKEGSYLGENYYFLRFDIDKAMIGWVKANDVQAQDRSSDRTIKKSFVVSDESDHIYSQPWGTSNQRVSALANLKGGTFNATKETTIGGKSYIYGTIDGKSGWVLKDNLMTMESAAPETKTVSKMARINSNNQGLKSPLTSDRSVSADRYIGDTYYVSKEGSYLGENYYFLRFDIDKAMIGWIKASDVKTANRSGDAPIDQTFYINNSSDRLFSQPWGTSDQVVSSLTNYQNESFKATKKVTVGNTDYYYGTLKNHSGWIKSGSLSEYIVSTVKYGISLDEAIDTQMSLRSKPQSWVSGGGWRDATRDEVEYFINPANHTTDTWDYTYLDLNRAQNISSTELNNKLLSGKGVLHNQGTAFLQAANTHGVNEVYLVSHALHETGNGQSQLAQGIRLDEKGNISEDGKLYYNMYGIAAYDHNPVLEGARYAQRMGWDTPAKAVIGGAQFISSGYFNRGQNTLYAMRWNPVSPGTYQYATDVNWAYATARNLKNYYDQLGIRGQYYTRYTF